MHSHANSTAMMYGNADWTLALTLFVTQAIPTATMSTRRMRKIRVAVWKLAGMRRPLSKRPPRCNEARLLADHVYLVVDAQQFTRRKLHGGGVAEVAVRRIVPQDDLVVDVPRPAPS